VHLGAIDPAAIVLGYVSDRIVTVPRLDPTPDTNATLRQELGDQRLAELTALGAAMSHTDAVEYFRSIAEPLLGD
jgi:hypothetical protein